MKTTAKNIKGILGGVARGSLILALAASFCISSAWAFGRIENTEEDGKCLLANQLKDPAQREDYLLAVAFLKNPRDFRVVGDAGSMYRDPIPVSYSAYEPPAKLDRMSFECLTCHDGTTAQVAEVRFKSSNDTNNYADITRNHPIGIDYEEAASRHPGQYRSIDSLDPRVTLVDGKLGCITCHEPLNPKKSHMSMNNDGSALCLECHIR